MPRISQRQSDEASVGAGRRFGQPWPEEPDVGQRLTAAGRAGQRAPRDVVDMGLRSVRNVCGAALFEAHVLRAQCGAGGEVSGGDDDVDAVVTRIVAPRRGSGEQHQGARQNAASGHSARPVGAHCARQPVQCGGIERAGHAATLRRQASPVSGVFAPCGQRGEPLDAAAAGAEDIDADTFQALLGRARDRLFELGAP